MTVSRSPVALALVLLLASASFVPGVQAQGIVDTLRDVLGPPVEDGAPARQRPRNAAGQAPREATPVVPVPSARPGEGGASDPADDASVETSSAAAGDATNAAPAASPALDDTAGEAAEGEATAEPAEIAAPPIPEPSPQDELPSSTDASRDARPEPEAAPADIPAAPAASHNAAGDEPAAEPAEPAPGPAYVSPEKARTVPEPSAPATPPSEISPEEAAAAAAAIEDARLCEEELTKRGAEFTTGPSIAEGACGVLRPVQLTRLSSGVTVSPATQMLCRTALALDIWAADGVETAARNTLDGGTVTAVEHASTYVCRDRASESGISEHGRGSAIDIAAFVLEDGRRIVVEDQTPQSAEDRFLADARRAACGPFSTVIGPGTDADHADHLHLDIAARANGSLYCR